MMGCELLTSVFKKNRNGSNGYGFMSVWAVAALPLTQLGTPYAAVCIFYDVGRLTSLTGSGALQQHTHVLYVETIQYKLHLLYINVMTYAVVHLL